MDTSLIHPGALHYKDKIYLDGYMKVTQWLARGGDKKDLMIGKVKIEDLKYIH